MVHEWIQQGATSCVFAQRRSRNAGEAQWLGIRVNTPPEPRELDGLQAILEAASDPQAVLLVFPHATSTADLVDIVASLAAHDSWECELVPREDQQSDGHSEVGVRWLLPHSKYRSEALGFGPIDCLPVTRRAPVTALTFRTHPPASPEKNNRVHLAQMPFDDLELEKRNQFWVRTQEQKADLLNGDLLHAARARVSWRLPTEDVQALGLEFRDKGGKP